LELNSENTTPVIRLAKNPIKMKGKRLVALLRESRGDFIPTRDTLRVTMNTKAQLDSKVDEVLGAFRDFYKAQGRLPRKGEVKLDEDAYREFKQQ